MKAVTGYLLIAIAELRGMYSLVIAALRLTLITSGENFYCHVFSRHQKTTEVGWLMLFFVRRAAWLWDYTSQKAKTHREVGSD